MNEIISAFKQIRFVFESSKFHLRPNSNEGIFEDTSSIESIIQLFINHKKQRPKFYKRFNYEWVFQPDNYTNALECLYQYYLLTILADITDKHPNYEKLGNIAVRFLSSGNLNAYSIKHDNFKYIIFSTTFLKFLQEFLLAIWHLSQLGTKLELIPIHTLIKSNHIQGAKIETALRYNFKACESYLDRLISVACDYAEYEAPSAKPLKLAKEIDLNKEIYSFGHELLSLYETVEVFVLCHELAHVLEHDFQNLERSTSEEFEADYLASSLYMIHNAHNIKHKRGYLLGPALFFQLMRFFIMCRRVTNFLVGEKEYINLDIEEEKILRERMYLYDGYNKKWGLIPLSDQTYKEVIIELSLIIAGCQIRLLQTIKAPKIPTLDELINPSCQL